MRFQKLALTALAASLASAQDALNLTAALGSASNASALVTLLGAYPGLVSTLSNATNITLLAPSNAALSALLNSTAGRAASAIPGYVEALLSYHVLNGTFFAANFTNTSQFIPTTLTNSTFSNVTGGQVVEAILTGETVSIFSGLKNNVTVAQADIAFSGGVIHVIDGVLTIPENLTATATAANLTALAGAAAALNLTNTLDGLSDVTVFAPNNAAFQAISSYLTANTTTTENLTSILQYHVINGTVGYSAGLTNANLTTLGGQNLTITVLNGTVYVNGARVITPDVLVAGGVVHVIDGVLNPLNATQTADSTASTPAPAFSGASSGTNVPFTSGITPPTSTAPAGNSATTSQAAGSSPTSSSSGVAAMPMKTGAVGAAALFGGAVMLANW